MTRTIVLRRVMLILMIFLMMVSGCQNTDSSSPTEPKTLQADTWNARVTYQGHVWYYGKSRLSCEDVCGPHGGCDEAGMALIGSGTSAAMCRNVMNELGVPVNSYEVGEARFLPHKVDMSRQPPQWQVGCGYAASYGETGIRLLYYPSNPGASGPADPEFSELFRICACQQ